MYLLLLSLIYLAFISLGLPDSLLGAGWPVMHGEFEAPISYMGLVTMVISGCTIVSSLVSHRLTKKLGTAAVTVASVFLTAAALIGFSFASEFWMLIVIAVPYGLGAGAIDAALNNYVALHYTSNHMSWLHCFWGVGTIISPFIMSYALKYSVWRTGYQTVGMLQLAIGIILLLTLPVWKTNKNKSESSKDVTDIGIKDAMRIKGVPYLLLGFFAYCAAEATAMGWASTYFAEVKGVTDETAAAYASLFFIGLTGGRFLGGFIMNRLGDRKMILLGTAISVCGMLCLLIPWQNVTFAVVGFVVIGFGFAPIYPCIIHSTPYNFGEESSGAIIGIQMASAYVGATFMPPLYGLLGKGLGYGILPLYVIGLTAIMIILTEKAFKTASATK